MKTERFWIYNFRQCWNINKKLLGVLRTLCLLEASCSFNGFIKGIKHFWHVEHKLFAVNFLNLFFFTEKCSSNILEKNTSKSRGVKGLPRVMNAVKITQTHMFVNKTSTKSFCWQFVSIRICNGFGESKEKQKRKLTGEEGGEWKTSEEVKADFVH